MGTKCENTGKPGLCVCETGGSERVNVMCLFLLKMSILIFLKAFLTFY